MNNKVVRKNPLEILEERAEKLARRDAREVEADDSPTHVFDCLEVDMAGERFGIETGYVREVRKLETLTPVPCTPPWMKGVVSVRGHILQVVDIGVYFGLTSSRDSYRQLVVVGKGDTEFCLLAENVHDVRSIGESMIVRQPESGFAGASYCRGITGDRLFVLMMDRLIDDPGLEVDEEVSSAPGMGAGSI